MTTIVHDSGLDFTCERVETADQMRAALARQPWDVVLSDYHRSRAGPRGGELRPGLPVLHMSRYSDDAVARHGVLDPGTVLIQRPFTPSQFADKVREALGGATRSNRIID